MKQLMNPETSGRILQHQIDPWLFAYRNTPDSTIKVSLVVLFLGRLPIIRLSLLKPNYILEKNGVRTTKN